MTKFLSIAQLEYINSITFNREIFISHSFTVLENSIQNYIDSLLSRTFMQTQEHNDLKFETLQDLVSRRDAILEEHDIV